MAYHKIDSDMPQAESSDALKDDDDLDGSETNSILEEQPTTANQGLSWLEKKNLFFLLGLYFLHALPLGFSWITMPILLRQQVSYTAVGTYYIAQYPYSIKVIWSPIVKTLHISALGKRKTWLVPCFMISGTILLWLSMTQDRIIGRIAHGEGFAMAQLILSWISLMFLGSCIRMTLDDWALDLLSHPNVHWISTTMTVGELAGMFVAFNVYLGISNADSSQNQHVSTTPFCFLTAIAAILTSLYLCIRVREQSPPTSGLLKQTVRGTYKIIYRILCLPQVHTLMLIHMASMIGFQTNDSITILQLVKEGFNDRDLAALGTISFPCEVLTSILISRLFATQHPLQVWRRLFPFRLFVAVVAQCGILLITYSRDNHSHLWRWSIALLPYLMSKFFETAMFVSLVAFHAQISDPRYGGIYLPLLATTANLRYDTLQFIYTKTIGAIDGGEDLTKPTPLIDGYQIVNLSTVLLAVPIFMLFLRPATKRLQAIPVEEWMIKDRDLKGGEVGVDGRAGQAYELLGVNRHNEEQEDGIHDHNNDMRAHQN